MKRFVFFFFEAIVESEKIDPFTLQLSKKAHQQAQERENFLKEIKAILLPNQEAMEEEGGKAGEGEVLERIQEVLGRWSPFVTEVVKNTDGLLIFSHAIKRKIERFIN